MTSSGGGGTGAAIGDPTGDGNVTDFGSFEAVFAAGVALAFASAAGRGRETERFVVSLAGASRLGFAAGVAFGSSAGRDATGAGAGCCSAMGAEAAACSGVSADLPCNFGLGAGPHADRRNAKITVKAKS